MLTYFCCGISNVCDNRFQGGQARDFVMESGVANISDVFSQLSGRPDRHSIFEDAQGILAGALIASLGLFFMGKAHLVTLSLIHI